MTHCFRFVDMGLLKIIRKLEEETALTLKVHLIKRNANFAMLSYIIIVKATIVNYPKCNS